MKGPASLQGRLAVLLLVSVPLIWLMATGFAVYAAHHEVDELYDTQLTLFARQLLTVQLTGEDDERPPTLPDTKATTTLDWSVGDWRTALERSLGRATRALTRTLQRRQKPDRGRGEGRWLGGVHA